MRKKIMDIVLWEELFGPYAEVMMESDGYKEQGHRGFYSIESLIKLLDLSKEIEICPQGKKISLGLIPQGLHDCSVFVDDFGNIIGQNGVFVVPEGVRTFRYSLHASSGFEKETGAVQIPFPKLLFWARAKNGHTVGLNCFAYVANILTEQTKLFRYPFGNVNANGNVCMGGFGMDISGFYDLYAYVSAFYELTTNDDLYDTGSNKSGMRQLDFIKTLEGKETFPVEMLSEVGTYGELIKL